MAKKPNISKEAQVLLKLLRIALGTEPKEQRVESQACLSYPESRLRNSHAVAEPRKYFGEVVEPFPEEIDWREVVRLSYEHKVPALAVDGLQASKYDPYKGLNEKQTEELKAVLVPWYKDVESIEWSYCYYVEVLKTLCQIFKDNGLTPIILKGYGLSLNYPKPSHRGAGDIDIFLIDMDGKPAAEDGDRIARDILALEVERPDHNHHSSFMFKGIRVENHYKLFEDCRVDRQELLESKLTSETVAYKEFPNALFISPTINAVYLLAHMYAHATVTYNSCRQFVDFALFLRNNENKIDKSIFNEIINSLKIAEYADGMFGVLSYYFLCNLRLSDKPVDEELSNSIIQDSFISLNAKYGFMNVKRFYVKRWHHRYYHNKSWLIKTIKYTFEYLVRIFSVNSIKSSLVSTKNLYIGL